VLTELRAGIGARRLLGLEHSLYPVDRADMGGADALEAPRVLVIEDDPGMQDLLRDVLEEEGFRPQALGSAIGAAGLVRQLQPELILLDLALPVRSGELLLRELKADRATARIPVIVVSAISVLLTDEERAMTAAVVAKPFELQTLLDAIRRNIGRTPEAGRASAARLSGPRLLQHD
jgi:DNA-binding response OmpR family regulator